MKKTLTILISALMWVYASAQEQVSTENPETRGYKVAIGDQAPDFVIAQLDGKKMKLSSLRGKVVMLQFTASWSQTCRNEMPLVETDIWQKLRTDTNFVLIGIDLKEDAKKAHKLIADTKITYPLALDENGDIFARYTEKNAGVTRNILIAPNGKIIFMTRLYDPDEFKMLVQIIEQELKNIK